MTGKEGSAVAFPVVNMRLWAKGRVKRELGGQKQQTSCPRMEAHGRGPNQSLEHREDLGVGDAHTVS